MPARILIIIFYDETIASFYTNEKNISRLLSGATAIAIFIQLSRAARAWLSTPRTSERKKLA
jgi:hypothetical protein